MLIFINHSTFNNDLFPIGSGPRSGLEKMISRSGYLVEYTAQGNFRHFLFNLQEDVHFNQRHLRQAAQVVRRDDREAAKQVEALNRHFVGVHTQCLAITVSGLQTHMSSLAQESAALQVRGCTADPAG